MSLFCLGGLVFLAVSWSQSHSRPVGHGDVDFDVFPDDSKVVFAGEGIGGRDLYIIDLRTSVVERLTSSEGYESDPSVSPEGRYVVYSYGKPGVRADHLILLDLRTSQSRQLTNLDANDCSASFSADGSRIFFLRDENYRWGGLASSWSGGGALWSIKLDGSDLQRHVPQVRLMFQPSISVQSELVAWDEGYDGSAYVGTLDGSIKEKVNVDYGRGIDFGPDENLIALDSGVFAPDSQIGTYDRRSGRHQILDFTPKFSSSAKFSSDGKKIFFLNESWPNGYSGEPVRTLWVADLERRSARQIGPDDLFSDPMRRNR